MRKLGLIAGGGELPVTLASHCLQAGRPLFVLRLRGFAKPALGAYAGADVGLAELGRILALLRETGCQAVCLVGNVARPDFSALKPDLRGLRSLPGAINAARKGDDALLRFLVQLLEEEGFAVEGAQAVDAGLLLQPGPLGGLALTDAHRADAAQAIRIACALGALDVGQATVVVDGLALAVEAQEGTDAMLERCAELPAALRGTPQARRGVLAKWPKPIQERRVDLPTIGVRTIEFAAAAGLAGVVGEAGALLLIERAAIIEAADRLGLFVEGVPEEACC